MLGAIVRTVLVLDIFWFQHWKPVHHLPTPRTPGRGKRRWKRWCVWPTWRQCVLSPWLQRWCPCFAYSAWTAGLRRAQLMTQNTQIKLGRNDTTEAFWAVFSMADECRITQMNHNCNHAPPSNFCITECPDKNVWLSKVPAAPTRYRWAHPQLRHMVNSENYRNIPQRNHISKNHNQY